MLHRRRIKRKSKTKKKKEKKAQNDFIVVSRDKRTKILSRTWLYGIQVPQLE